MALDGIVLADGVQKLLDRVFSYAKWRGRPCECRLEDGWFEYPARCRKCRKMRYAKACGFCVK